MILKKDSKWRTLYMKKRKLIFLAVLITILIAVIGVFSISHRNNRIQVFSCDDYVRVFCSSGYPPIRGYRSNRVTSLYCPGHNLPREGLAVFGVDIIEEYQDTLQGMFGEKWTVLSVEERYSTRVIECHLMGGPLHRYTKWIIEYIDGNGEARTFEVNNHSPFDFHVTRHIEEMVTQFYEEYFLNVYEANLTVASLSRPVRSSFVIWTDFWDPGIFVPDSAPPWVAGAVEHRRTIATPEGAIPLGQISPRNIFEYFPLYLSFRFVAPERGDSDRQEFWDNLFEDVELMISSLNDFSEGHANMVVRLNGHWWAYAQGESVLDEMSPRGRVELREFERIVFERFIENQEIDDE
jgi:hypothetical protein